MQLFVDQLTNVDFSYLDTRRGLVGETWWASAILDGALDAQGMVCDFGIVKKTLRHWLDEQLDHRLLVPVRSPALTLTEDGERITLSWRYDSGEQLTMEAPRQAVALVDAEMISADTVSDWCREQLRDVFPVNVDQLTLIFAPEEIRDHYYHYSHGLKKHTGNCQRIAHGHRSRLEIWRAGNRDKSLESEWAERFNDIYLATEEDITARDDDTLSFAYEAQQGAFCLSLPARCCYLMDTDTTVEYIAAHLASEVRAGYPTEDIEVKAFEGVNKGAIAN
ncbi:MAG: hypothetical protein CMI02_11380 [Oceanospirillaceae bacterium]|nr:hypothetical protein [Oceanospirillaceae bacterium]MBT11509.1 hypothetical protein [Oceanospirillaceae bacterium]MBT12620.1 hypothetical protein [Oceanospirillaceae bacterium]|tara:strand:+ start:34155 stop:34988 length:834 start_codon:yes stop_codon:yes gene_type:complete